MANHNYERRNNVPTHVGRPRTTHAPLPGRNRGEKPLRRPPTKGEITKNLAKLGAKLAFIGWIAGSLADNVVSYEDGSLALAPKVPFSDKPLFKLPAITIKKTQTTVVLPPGARTPTLAPPPKIPTVDPKFEGQLHPKSCEPGAESPDQLYFASKPTVTPDIINAELKRYNSPAAGKGEYLYNAGVANGIDPAYALAFFIHESSAGTAGVARYTHSIGNIRPSEGWVARGGKVVNVNGEIVPNYYYGMPGSYYRYYPSWEAGIADWYRLIREVYIADGLETLDTAIPVYAPSDDDNDPDGYKMQVRDLVCGWREKYGKAQVEGNRKTNYTSLYSRADLKRRNAIFSARSKTS